MDQTSSTEPIGEDSATAPRKTGAGKVPVIIAILAIIVAVVFGALYFTSRVPGDAAAKLDDGYITESQVNDYVAQYRASQSLTDDAAFSQALSSQGLTVAKLRINAIDQVATTQLVNKQAEELGVTPSDGEVQAKIDEAKSTLAFNDDSIWERTLEQYGMTEDQVREQNRNNLAQSAVLEKDVPRREATNAETLAYAKSNLAGSDQKHFTSITFTGKNAKKNAQSYSTKLSKYLATRSFATAKDMAKDIKAHARKNGAAVASYKWTIGLDSNSELTQTLNNLDVGDTSSVQNGSDGSSATIYLCDDDYTFPESGNIDSLKKSDLPSSLWNAVKDKAAESAWNSDCSTYLANLLAQAKITYYPLPDDVPYMVDQQTSSSEG